MQIKIYTLSWCSHCKALKEFLKNKGLEFENLDVEEDQEAANYITQKTGQSGFPIVCIDNETLIGFNAQKIESIINNSNDSLGKITWKKPLGVL